MPRHVVPEPSVYLFFFRVAVMNDDRRGFFCLAWRHGNRVHHWHWPRVDVVNCKNAIGVTRPDPEPPEDPPSSGWPSATGWPS
jgi:hypothetical protein